MPVLKISAKIPPGQHLTATAESPVVFTPTFITSRGDTDAVRLVEVRVGGVPVLRTRTGLALMSMALPRALASPPLGPGKIVEAVFISQRDTPAELEIVFSDVESL